MKLNKISMMLAAAALVGCSDDFSERFTGQAIDDSRLIQLDANFVLGGVGDEGATTRTHWEQIGSTNSFQNVFLPTLTTAGTSGSNLVTACGAQGDEVGLCWLGQGAPTSEVYTNYQFAHAGWLYTNQKAPQISCNELENGIWYKETELNASVAAGKEVQALQLRGTTVSGKSAAKFVLDPNSPTDKDVNLNSGVYKTENKAIFGGDYIVYYPFNENFNEKGTIPAVAVTQFGDGTSTSAPTSLDDPALAEATFRYSDPVTIKGGDQAAGFKMHNLSTLVRLKVSTVAVGGIATSDKIDQIVLCSREGQLLAQANLAANLIVGGEKSGTELYAERKYIKTIVANFKSGDELTDIDSNTPKDAYVTVLPTTVENLKVLVHKTDGTSGKWATVVIGEKKFEAGSATKLDLVVKESDFKTDYIAVDDVSLQTALTEIGAAEGSIEVIGDITVDNRTIPAKVTVWGDKLIVPENKTLTVKGTVKCEIEVNGKGCCSPSSYYGATLEVGNIDSADPAEISKVTLFKTEDKDENNDDYKPYIQYLNNTYSVVNGLNTINAGVVEVFGTVSHKGDFTTDGVSKVTVFKTGVLNFMGATVTNNGNIEVMKEGHFDMTDATGNATADDGKRMTNNGTFIHNVDAAVGTAVQAMNQNGEYRCKVDGQNKLSDAYHQWTACSVIEMVNTTTCSYNLGIAADITPDADGSGAYKHRNKYIDIVVNAGAKTTFDNPGSPNGDGKNVNIGHLTVKSELEVDYVKGNGKRILTVNGDALVESAGTMTYKSANAIAVTENIIVDGGKLETKDDALNTTCNNFYLKNAGTATFGNRSNGVSKTMTVNGTISNPAGCTFKQNPGASGKLLAWITCKTLKVGGSFPGGQPKVVN